METGEKQLNQNQETGDKKKEDEKIVWDEKYLRTKDLGFIDKTLNRAADYKEDAEKPNKLKNLKYDLNTAEQKMQTIARKLHEAQTKIEQMIDEQEK